MKNLVKTFFVIALLTVASNAAAQQKTVQKAVIKTEIVCDHCRECETCGGLLEKKLLKTKGIQMITLNETQATIEIIYNSKKIDLATIKTAISKLGYAADEVRADPARYEQLAGCCQA